MKHLLCCLLFVLSVFAQEQRPVFDKKFFALSVFTISATMADSYTTSQIGVNYHAWLTWRSTPSDPTFYGSGCISETNEPWLYGAHPSAARAYGVGAGKIAVAEVSAALLKRSHRFHRLWSVPLFVIGTDSAVGAIHNARTC